MRGRMDPVLFARVMALPRAQREDLLEFFGGSPVDSTCLEALIQEVSGDIRKERERVPEPN